MTSPLPAAPTPPDLPTLPSNPLPRLSIGHPGGARLPRLRLPTGATHRAPRPPIGHRPPPNGAGRPPVAPAPRTVVNVQAAPANPPVAPVRAAGARPTAGQEREASRTFLGDRLGGLVNRMPRESRLKHRTLLRSLSAEHMAEGERRREGYFDEQIAKRNASKATAKEIKASLTSLNRQGRRFELTPEDAALEGRAKPILEGLRKGRQPTDAEKEVLAHYQAMGSRHKREQSVSAPPPETPPEAPQP